MHKQCDCTSLCPPWCQQCPLKLGALQKSGGNRGTVKKIFRRLFVPPLSICFLRLYNWLCIYVELCSYSQLWLLESFHEWTVIIWGVIRRYVGHVLRNASYPGTGDIFPLYIQCRGCENNLEQCVYHNYNESWYSNMTTSFELEYYGTNSSYVNSLMARKLRLL